MIETDGDLLQTFARMGADKLTLAIVRFEVSLGHIAGGVHAANQL